MSDNIPIKKITKIGADPATVNYGIVRIEFYGFYYKTDSAGVEMKVPHFKMLNAELWDLQRKIIYRAGSDGKLSVKHFPGVHNASNQSLLSLTKNIVDFVADSKWIFEKVKNENNEDSLAELVTELQAGFIMNHELPVVMVSYELPCAIKAIDSVNKDNSRSIISGAKKYGIKRGEDSDKRTKKEQYDKNKEDAEKITRTLFELCGMKEWLAFFDDLSKELKKAGKKVQVHDICDAFLLALNHCITVWEENKKNRKTATATATANTSPTSISSPVSITITDDDDEFISEAIEEQILKVSEKIDISRKSKSKSKKGNKTASAKEFFDQFENEYEEDSFVVFDEEEEEESEKNDDEEEEEIIRSKKKKDTKRKKTEKKRKLSTISEDELAALAPVQKKKKTEPKQRRKSSEAAKSKYKPLKISNGK